MHGHQVQAFPKTWCDMLIMLFEGIAGIRGGALALLASILEWDDWAVTFSGHSWVQIIGGIPEGEGLGPTGFNLFPDAHTRMLENAGHGVARSGWVPNVWRAHVWTGMGTPQPSLVVALRAGLRGESQLANAELLRQANIEASAARALDLQDSDRVVGFRHADDPQFLASSRGAAQDMLRVLGEWGSRFRAEFHVADKKTVPLLAGAVAAANASLAPPMLSLTQLALERTTQVRWTKSAQVVGAAISPRS